MHLIRRPCRGSSAPRPRGHRRRHTARLLPLLLVLTAGACSTWEPRDSEDGRALAGTASTLQQRTAAAKKWGLDRAPLEAPPPPKEKLRPETPESLDRGPDLIPVFSRVPTTDKVVFLTVDDGAAKDHSFLDMVRELKVPLSAFLTDESAASDYGYFRDLHELGVPVQNHTLTHPQMTTLTADEQYDEICGQQDVLEEEIGVQPWLFRPPFGDYDEDTLIVAEECGARAAPLWSEEAFPDRMEYSRDDAKLHPGDIILSHFNGPHTWGAPITDMLRLVLREVTEQGFALARLEDYI
ncbi:polysaccharide deacetylase family protein [Streptomyces albireticuli]|nr:polysaccharide deacetylase family protein [Streptomyces albireticuli]MCD9145405.1 polysaccharide deacetylase family protein [Streptomyces albireticuli]MCD9165030.1 polysaccharide deacetylase family protein [Streptomyces albireticuli]MCD9195379.1 polysaccharide deacetylase family protein [Streptomyces albireticuli]